MTALAGRVDPTTVFLIASAVRLPDLPTLRIASAVNEDERCARRTASAVMP
jgi:hypothetical protein